MHPKESPQPLADTEMHSAEWHLLDADTVLQRLAASRRGLDSAEARRRLQHYGANLLPSARRRSWLRMLLGQFADFMILVLLVAALISGFIGEPQDTVTILLIVLLNALIGTLQEFRAERALSALQAMAAPMARVLRDGQPVLLAASELVPGDLVLLESGNQVPADLRLLEAEDLQADESALTGESLPVDKQSARQRADDGDPATRHNLLFNHSLITRGRACAVVVATGLQTRMGRIAQMLQTEQGVSTPLQQRLLRFGRYLVLAVLVICALVFVVGVWQGQAPMLMLLTAVSLAVAAIPEALPAVVTISLALGARKLVRHHALVRNLPAVETLGSVTYICADKTGTLTQNRMRVEALFAAGERIAVLPPRPGPPWLQLGQAMALSNDVALQDGRMTGEATELALFDAAARSGFHKTALEQAFPRLLALAFDGRRKCMTTLHQSDPGVVAYTKGAPETVLSQCVRQLGVAAVEPFEEQTVLAEVQRLTEAGYRVLAFAMREFASLPAGQSSDSLEQQLTFLGLVGLMDPPRQEAAQALSDCHSAGITTVMITGDHPGTAMTIARGLGIARQPAELLSGGQLAALSDAELARKVGSIRVYARVTPEQKLRIVKALQANGEFVAMTGDGVNDAPALQRAGIGVAMGCKGTDVAREAADMVLLDDNFASIVHSVRAGRRIFDNIRKFIKYTMTSNAGEIWTLFLAPFMGLPVPLLPIHILWINLVTDGLPGLALTLEPAEPAIMQRPPRPPTENIFAHGLWQHIVWAGLYIGGISLAAMAWAIAHGQAYWQTMVFTVLTVAQLFHALAVRSERQSLLRLGLLSNQPLLGTVLLTLLLQLAVIYTPVLNRVFHTQPLPPFALLLCLLLSATVLLAVEAEKWLLRRGLLYPGARARDP
ncbi:cation-translocating P-type ATPase [Shewanella sp. AS16]|uniref:cation-translocating P-type ATPase n=1 Tax=Shewanella sp. AS16 TaxID=2907625 RepID=UPI001F4580E4|nr:cation-translocating P-type ATPase [Shewanella sp. AS16]MCE9688215.1 cation-translocating P-type ATPase [Shewanella sp. AS16]